MKRTVILLIVLALTFPVSAMCMEDIKNLPGKANVLHDLPLRLHVSCVSQITGEESPNKTLSRFNVWGTDLGSMTEMDGKVYMFCGDTFENDKNEGWRSNVLFIIEDDEPSDGLTITGTIADKWGRSKELLLSRKQNKVQMTVIPTNIFSIGDTLYCVYMSVQEWGDPGKWTCDYSGLAVSKDQGETWERPKKLRWPGDSGFIQTASCVIGDTLYLWGIPSGRFGSVSLAKCSTKDVEDFEQYSYFTGCDESGQPQWLKGSQGIEKAVAVVEAPCGEISVSYNPYLGNFVMTYLNERKSAIVMREGIAPWGEWGEEHILASASDYPSLYGAYMLDKYQEEDGKTFYFAMSQFFPVYNVLWMKAELPDLSK